MKPKKQQQQDKEVIDKNKEFNNEVVPKKFRHIDPYYQYVRRFDIPIGSEDPVLLFKQWDGEYWKKKAKE